MAVWKETRVSVTTAPPRAGGVDQPARRKAVRRTRRGRFFGLRLTLAILITLVVFFPMYWMVVTAFSTKEDMYLPGLHLWPQHFTLDNFRVPFEDFPIWRWFRNTVVITVLVTVITVVVNLLAGYAFAKMPFRGRNALFLILLSTMMIPIQAIMVPQFELSIRLGLFGNIWSVILPESASVFGIFLARQFFLAIPDELVEAARVDGAGHFRTFVSIVMPLCKPLVAVLVLLSFMSEWNQLAWSLIVLVSNQDLFTLPLGIVTELKGQYTSNYGAIMAITLVAITPMVILFVSFQRYFVQGLARTGIK
jgi:multiple sugar transport system permease protein